MVLILEAVLYHHLALPPDTLVSAFLIRLLQFVIGNLIQPMFLHPDGFLLLLLRLVTGQWVNLLPRQSCHLVLPYALR